jgi:hypothetical protein
MEAADSMQPSIGERARRVAAMRWPWLVLLLIMAVSYYGSYYRHSINFRDEGGTVALLSKRLLDGERPFLDVVLGYNVLWFYPVVGLYKLFGVSFVLLRVYCFALSTLTAVLGFLAVWKAGEPADGKAPSSWWRGLLAFAVSLLLVLVPGMTFKNYMPLLAVANSLCLLHVALAPVGSREALWKSLIGGVGLFCMVLWFGLHALRIFSGGVSLNRRIASSLLSIVLIAVTAWAVHVPVWLDAKRRRFDQQFVAQYSAWVGSLGQALHFRVAAPQKQVKIPTADAQAVEPATIEREKAPAHSWNREILKRNAWRDLRGDKSANERALTILTYAPLLSLLPLIFFATVRFGRASWQGQSSESNRSLAALVAIGGALTTFPQFFFFRPDSPHLSEFSPGFWVAVGASLLLLRIPGSARSLIGRWLGRLLVLLVVLHAALYLWRMLPDRWTGTIAARNGRSQMFSAENGVQVYVSKREKRGLEPLLKLLREHSKPGEYLVAYPYHPAINLLADRPTYEKNVYIDNATRSKNWDRQAIKRFEKFRPAVIVLSEWDINGTEGSRFSIWATRTKTWVQTNYIYQGTYLEFEVYTRPPQQSPEATALPTIEAAQL